MGKCKCKNPKSIKVPNGVKCEKCDGWIIRERVTFHKPTKVKEKKKGYNRKKEDRKWQKELER